MNWINLASILFLFLVCQSCQNTPSAKEKMVTEKNTNSYSEKHRPQFHFSPEEKWMNDPNGMVYFDGEYHLFYQYYPDSTVWGPMHWGHAITKDLVHWEHLPIALYPDSLGYIFSGSAVVDRKNTSGFGENNEPPLIAIFTHHSMQGEKKGDNNFQYQSIAYSNDKGRTWTKYDGNPVIPNTNNIRDFRDPKVIWDKVSGKWIMVFAAYDHVKIWNSDDLKNWTHLSDWGLEYGEHGGVWECPDLFPLAVDGESETKWVLLLSINPGLPNGGSGTQYFVGDFDGKNFTLDKSFANDVTNGQSVWLDYGRDNYAGVTWSDIPKEDGRRLFLGWMSNWDYAQKVPTEVWRSAMTIPRTLVLKKTENSYRIFSEPVDELNQLRNNSFKLEKEVYTKQVSLSEKNDFNPNQTELLLEFDLESSTSKRFGMELSNKKGENYKFGFNVKENSFFSDRTKAGNHAFSDNFGLKESVAPRLSNNKKMKLHVFIDASSIEVFADEGATALTEIFFPSENFDKLSLFTEGGETALIKGEVYQLNQIWE